MFDSLSERLGGILDRLTGRGALSEADVDTPRCAKCAARCWKPTSRSMWCGTFTEQVKKNAVGVALIKSVKPGQMVVSWCTTS